PTGTAPLFSASRRAALAACTASPWTTGKRRGKAASRRLASNARTRPTCPSHGMGAGNSAALPAGPSLGSASGMSDLHASNLLPVHVTQATFVAELEVFHVSDLLADERGPVSVARHLVQAGHDLMHVLGVVDVAALRSVAQ